MLIPLERVGDLSFPDCVIRDFSYRGNTLRFVSDGIFIDGNGFIDQRATIECLSFGTGLSRQFVNDEWIDVDAEQDGLSFIGEWSIEKESLRLAGFDAQSGKWREYCIFVISVSLTTDITT